MTKIVPQPMDSTQAPNIKPRGIFGMTFGTEMLTDQSLKGPALILYDIICGLSRCKDGCRLSNATLGPLIRCAPNRVHDHVQALEAKGYIKVSYGTNSRRRLSLPGFLQIDDKIPDHTPRGEGGTPDVYRGTPTVYQKNLELKEPLKPSTNCTPGATERTVRTEKPTKKKPQKEYYIKLERIKLTKVEYLALEKEFSTELLEYYLPFLSDWLKGRGERCRTDCAAFVRAWLAKDKCEGRGKFARKKPQSDAEPIASGPFAGRYRSDLPVRDRGWQKIYDMEQAQLQAKQGQLT